MIRELTPDDVLIYREIRLSGLKEWPPAFGSPAEEFEKLSTDEIAKSLLRTADQCILGVYDENTLAGIARLSRYSGSNERHLAYVAGVYVLPSYRRRHLARNLMHEVIHRAKEDMLVRRLNLTVGTAQSAAIKLYQSLGFILCGTIPEAFESRNQYFDEHLMTLQLLNR